MRIFFPVLICMLLKEITWGQPTAGPFNTLVSAPILTGADQIDRYLPFLTGLSVAIFANQTSVVGKSHLVDTLLKRGVHIVKIFAPEHGFRGGADAGDSISNLNDPGTGIPIVSLYGSKLKPSVEDLEDVDILVFDIQDVGVRFYTYISSLQKLIESAITNDRPLIILDRPDPNGWYVDGPVLDPAFKSFIGMQRVPIVYGMTVGEYAGMLIGEHWLDPAADRRLNTAAAIGPSIRNPSSHNTSAPRIDSLIGIMGGIGKQLVSAGADNFRLIVIPCSHYTHQSKYALPVSPSPNLPTMQSVYLYPSLCFFEGTAISLGRGTPKPFQQFGNPSFPKDLYSFTPRSVPGARNPPLLNQTCYGYDLSKIDVSKETDGRLSLQWLLKAYRLFPDKEHFFPGSGGFFNKLAGNAALAQQIKDGKMEEEIRKSWEPALGNFKRIRKKYLLYAE
jgi:uncharacterized protein YbbC (DUF1343 family)